MAPTPAREPLSGGKPSEEAPDADRRPSVLGAALWTTGLACGALWLYLALAPFDRIGLYVQDDAFYYLMVARNWLANGFPSFDGVEPTNGFQPLWQVLQLPLALAGSRLLQLRLMLALAAALFQAGVLFAALGLQDLAGRRVARAFLVVAEAQLFLVACTALDGMEWSLQFFLLGAILWRLGRSRRTGAPAPLWLGVLAGLFGASRLEGLALAPFLGWSLHRRGVRPGRLALFAALALAPALAFLAANLAWTGSPLPVSGEAKLGWDSTVTGGGLAHRLDLGAQGLARAVFGVASRLTGGYAYFAARMLGVPHRGISYTAAAVAVALLAASLWQLRRRRHRALVASLAPVAAAAAVSLGFYAWSYPTTFHLYGWYFATEIFLGLVLLAVLAARVPWRALVAASGALLALNLAGFATNTENRAHTAPIEDAIAYIRDNPDLRALPLASWDAGLIGFLSGPPVTNLDGLINSRDFFERFVRGGRPLADYLDERHIEVVVNPVHRASVDPELTGFRGLPAERLAVEYLSPLYTAPFGQVRRSVVLRLLPPPSGQPAVAGD